MKIYPVGGQVRDKLLGLKPKDRDYVVVGATIDQMIDAGFQKIDAEFPIFIHPDSGRDEYALARQERKVSEGYRGFQCSFDPSVSLRDDLIRRDLTINAMAIDPDTDEIIDYFGGKDDLKRGILRHVSDAFAEDPLRVLRVARFAARLNFAVAPETLELMYKLAQSGELATLTPERVWNELTLALQQRFPQNFFNVLRQSHTVDILFPELDQINQVTLRALDSGASRNLTVDQMLVILTHDVSIRHVRALFTRLRGHNSGLQLVELAKELNSLKVFSPQNIAAFFSPNKQHDQLVHLIGNALLTYNDHKLNVQFDTLRRAFDVIKGIGFRNLSPEQQKRLRGREISKAIEQKRAEVLKSLFVL